MTRTLKRIAPVKFGIVTGAVYGLISLVFVPFFLLGALASAFAPAHQGSMQTGIAAGVGLIFCIVFPIIYAALGCLFGMLGARLYNVVAHWTGGIEFEVE